MTEYECIHTSTHPLSAPSPHSVLHKALLTAVVQAPSLITHPRLEQGMLVHLGLDSLGDSLIVVYTRKKEQQTLG